jgi:arylsulfatase
MRMAVYAAQVDRMDQGIGKVLAKLDELGIADDTLVMFLSDNGGCAEFLSEDGFTLPCNSYTQDGQKVRLGNHQDIIPGDATTYMSYDLPWSNVSNSPFRLFKHWVHEGGISTPFVARWSKVIPAGELRHEPEHVVDIVPTCLEAAGVSHPSEIDGREVNPLNGESFMPALRGESWIRSEPIYFEHEGNRAVRDGQWKIVSRDGRPWELYDMENDRTELNDLAHGNASILNRYAQMYERWAPANDVIDWKVILPIGKRIEANR